MEVLIQPVCLLLVAVGVVGVIVPVLPGASLVMAGILLQKLVLPETISWWTVAWAGVSLTLCWIADLVAVTAANRWSGSSRWAYGGMALGFLVGLFFGLPGLLLGPVAGAVAAEFIAARKTWSQALRSGLATAIGLAASGVVRLGLVLSMVVVYLADLLLKS
jgi:uncharacterized protein YqgC (DUF456 family)